MRRQPENMDALALRAEANSGRKNIAEAIQDYLVLAEHYPKEIKWLRYLAGAYSQLEDYANTFYYYNKAIELGCKDPDLFTSRGRLHLKLNMVKEGIDDLGTAVDLSQEELANEKQDTVWKRLMVIFNLTLRGDAYASIGDTSCMLEDYTAAVKTAEDGKMWDMYSIWAGDALHKRALWYVSQKQYKEALGDYTSLILGCGLERGPQRRAAQWYYERGYVEFLMGGCYEYDFKTAVEADSSYAAKPYK